MSHEILTVTSPLKMRNAQTLSLSYSGTRPQTIIFHRDPKIQETNLAATDRLLVSLNSKFLDSPSYLRDGEKDTWNSARLWTDVDHQYVLDFLGNYITHQNASSAKTSVLSDFISKMVEIGQLKQWSIALLAGGDGVGDTQIFPGGIEINAYPSRKTDDPEIPENRDPEKFAIGVLTDPKDEGIDIDDGVWREALALTCAAWKPDPARGRTTLPTKPSGKGIREARETLGGPANRGLLLLYPLSPYVGKDKVAEKLIVPGWDKPIMAFAIAFPSSRNAISVEYEVNLLYWMQEYGPSE